MKTTIVYWGYIGIMEKESGNYYNMLGFYMDNGKEDGNYYVGIILHTSCRNPK